MTIALIIGGIVVAAIAVILIIAAMKPSHFSVARTARINAPPEKIFPAINNLKAMLDWSPFEKDPNVKRTFTGPESGPGQVYVFDGNRNVGAGDVSITDSTPNANIAMKLNMSRPFECHNDIMFTLQPAGGGTDLTWAMSGPQPYMAKVMSTVINCDNMVGKMFGEGFDKLKAIVEK
jgi:uncharacterized protein YndB with AHSA1/START domain